MESITNAAKSVFGGSSGQSGQEPVSGQTGRGTASEPYDAGNTMGNVSSVNRTAFCVFFQSLFSITASTCLSSKDLYLIPKVMSLVHPNWGELLAKANNTNFSSQEDFTQNHSVFF